MTVFIDPPTWPAHGTVFSHLVSDRDYGELHRVAARAGVSRRAFDGDHYDVPAARHDELVRAGAVPTTGADLVRRLNASGLRLRKRKGDRGVARLLDQWTPFGPASLDVVASPRPLAHPTAFVRLQRSEEPWGVPFVCADEDSPDDIGAIAGDSVAVGWVRIEASHVHHLVQVLSGAGLKPTASPWSLLVQ